MNRLTRVIDLHNALPLATAGIEIEEPESYAYGYAVDILSAYEDTGLTPNQVEQMKQENAELKRLLKLAADDANALFVACDTEYMKHDSLSEPEMCRFCKYYRTVFCKCEPVGKCQWRYADNVKGLIEMKMNWIPVSERLPEKPKNWIDEYGREWSKTSDYFIITDDKGRVYVAGYTFCEKCFWYNYSLNEVNAVAWMPLPEPYEPE